MYRLLALDLDGTLLTPEGQMTQRTKAAIAKAQASGMKVFLVTGRSWQEAAWYSAEAGCGEVAVALGGAAYVDMRRSAVYRRWDMARDSGLVALRLCLDSGVELMIFAGNEIVVDPRSHESLLRTLQSPVFHQAAVVVEDPVAYLLERGLPVTKLHGAGDPSVFPMAALRALPKLLLTSSNDSDFEVLPASVEKGRSLAYLSRGQYGIKPSEIAVLGDSMNDLPMLRMAGLPMAMGNACDALKQRAAFVTGTNEEDGAAQAIEYCLAQNGVSI